MTSWRRIHDEYGQLTETKRVIRRLVREIEELVDDYPPGVKGRDVLISAKWRLEHCVKYLDEAAKKVAR